MDWNEIPITLYSFQDCFGVAHALADRERVVVYIVRQAQSATRFEEQYYEPCGWRGDFIRINIKAVAEGKISAEELADAMECRCYHGGDGRTKLKVMKSRPSDYIFLIVVTALTVGVFFLNNILFTFC